MFPEIFEFVKTMAAVICSAIAIKLADDYLDKEADLAGAQLNWSVKLGQGCMVYAMFFIMIAAGLSTSLTIALFFGSYITGMCKDLNKKFATRLSGRGENLIVLAIGSMILGWRMMLFGLTFMLAVQLVDDCIDIYVDSLLGQRNLACRFGKIECILSAVLCGLVSWWLQEQLFAVVLFGTCLFYAALLWHQRRRDYA